MNKRIVFLLLFVIALSPSFVSAQAVDEAKLLEKLNQTAAKGVEFLMEKGRDEKDGSYTRNN